MKKKLEELRGLETLDNYELEYVVKFLQNKLDKRKAEEEEKLPKTIEYIRVDEGSEGAFIRLDQWDKVDPIDLKNFITQCLKDYDESYVHLSRYSIFEDELEEASHVKEYDWFTFNEEIDMSNYQK